ncbi:bifunctional dihydroneopterin aldolase/dihydroneopterin triphosphate 2'-epimerase [Pseudooceanicola marinus]|uniref:dihydroneopterin aldolase n=1 Tax=Pseudooceanicola marinus TaxID=396013 RepID=A0A1X6YYR0_9RHOB|nr:dihydroneopterin aldolase [Pseudooceanicola marinus]PJE32602.1 diguanylate cyclase [Pseudooceanicola marinus]SLN35286.1 bifunctional dihydroneopterin aldolase/dihydroneopterin triphosphate 2'-epimerase [Pseudooceanicola marinus]
MSDQITQAFGHPLERSKAMSGDTPADRISLRDYLTEVEIGAFQQERGRMQRLRFNIVVEVRQQAAPVDDDVDRILSYDTITEAIEAELAAERLNLLETLAERITARILAESQAQRVFTRIEKLDRGPGALGVEIMRAEGDVAPVADAAAGEGTPVPLVVFLSEEATRSDRLSGWLDQLEADPRPVILACGPGRWDRPLSTSPQAQRRIDLLAIEQAAWVLAARDRRCVVVNSRTELDWAMKHDQISLWAPSKIVLDAAGDRPDAVGDGTGLVLWFAELMGASDVLFVGAPQPQPGDAGEGPRLAACAANGPLTLT